MQRDSNEGKDSAAQQAAKDWRKRFGREGHEGSYAQHEGGEAGDEKPAPEGTSRTSRQGSSA